VCSCRCRPCAKPKRQCAWRVCPWLAYCEGMLLRTTNTTPTKRVPALRHCERLSGKPRMRRMNETLNVLFLLASRVTPFWLQAADYSPTSDLVGRHEGSSGEVPHGCQPVPPPDYGQCRSTEPSEARCRPPASLPGAAIRPLPNQVLDHRKKRGERLSGAGRCRK